MVPFGTQGKSEQHWATALSGLPYGLVGAPHTMALLAQGTSRRDVITQFLLLFVAPVLIEAGAQALHLVIQDRWSQKLGAAGRHQDQAN